MKKFISLTVVAMMASAAWASVVTLDLGKPINPASIEYGDNNVWTECYNDVDYTWLEFGDENGEFLLSHLIGGEGMSWGGMYWDGFTPAIGGDITDYGQSGSSDGWTTNFAGCMAGGGCVINADGTVTADPSQPYLVAYYANFWGVPSNEVRYVDKDGNDLFEPVGVYITNHPWPYYGCVHGDGFGEGFQQEGDFFELTAVGVAADGTEKSVSINLIEFANGELHAITDWTFFDLSSLGEVESVYFTMNSSDVGPYGMNTAAYFCMDKFQVKGEDDPIVEPTEKTGAPVFNGYTTDGIHAYFVEINESETSTIYYRVQYGQNGEFTEWAKYEDVLSYTQDGWYRVEAYAVADGKLASDPIAYEFMVSPTTGLSEMAGSKTAISTRYYNMAGQEMQQASGLTIVVTTYTDGTTSAVKVMK